MMREWGMAWAGASLVQALFLCGLLSLHTTPTPPIECNIPVTMIIKRAPIPALTPQLTQKVISQEKPAARTKPLRAPKKTASLATPTVAQAPKESAPPAMTPACHQGGHVYTPPPTYPLRARRLGLEGDTQVALHVMPSGHINQCQVTHSSGHAILDESVCTALHLWKISPARSDHLAVASAYHLTIRFSLTGGVHF